MQCGEAENRYKEAKAEPGMSRLSGHRFKANFLLYLHAAAHNLMARLRRAVVHPALLSPNPELPISSLPGAEPRARQHRQRGRDDFVRAQT